MGKAYKCDICKKYHNGHHYASISIRLQKVDPRDGQPIQPWDRKHFGINKLIIPKPLNTTYSIY